MNPKKGLIGLFVLTFFLSTIGLALLVMDDQKDLSSRADIGLTSNLQEALPEGQSISSKIIWEARIQNLPVTVSYNPLLWIAPQKDAPVFLHQTEPVTVRLAFGDIDIVKLKELMGADFTTPKILGNVKVSVPGWTVRRYSFRFLGSEKIVDVWSNPKGLNLLAVMPDISSGMYIEDFASGISLESTQSKVKGATTADDSARLAALVRPSVVMIVNNYCAALKFLDRSYPFCLAQSGSGFFVNKDGYIATNGHVVKNLPSTSLFYGVATGGLDTFLIDFLQAYFSVQTGIPVDRALLEAKVKEAHTNKEAIYQMAALVEEMYKKNLVSLEKPENQFFVQLGNTPIQVSKTGVNLGDDIVKATFVDADYAEPDPALGFSSSDVALLKIEGKDFPALPLGALTDVSVGSSILLVGYPGVAMGSNSLLLDSSANAEPTFTKGVVSAFKQAKGNKKNLIQTDASINHGNSGGPSVNSDGKVVGIATYGLTPEEGSGNYNFLRDIDDLKALMSQNGVPEDMGQTFNIWKQGLESYWISYFKYAKTDFEKISALYPQHPTVGQYLKEAGSKIGSAEDRTPRFTRIQRKLYMNLSGGLMAFSVLMIIVLSISNYLDAKKRQTPIIIPPRDQAPPQPIQTF